MSDRNRCLHEAIHVGTATECNVEAHRIRGQIREEQRHEHNQQVQRVQSDICDHIGDRHHGQHSAHSHPISVIQICQQELFVQAVAQALQGKGPLVCHCRVQLHVLVEQLHNHVAVRAGIEGARRSQSVECGMQAGIHTVSAHDRLHNAQTVVRLATRLHHTRTSPQNTHNQVARQLLSDQQLHEYNTDGQQSQDEEDWWPTSGIRWQASQSLRLVDPVCNRVRLQCTQSVALLACRAQESQHERHGLLLCIHAGLRRKDLCAHADLSLSVRQSGLVRVRAVCHRPCLHTLRLVLFDTHVQGRTEALRILEDVHRVSGVLVLLRVFLLRHVLCVPSVSRPRVR